MFKELRWRDNKKQCIRCENTVIYTLSTGRLRCKICGLTFGDFTGTYLGQLNIPVNDIAHLLYLFSLGLPIYRCRHYLTISMKTAHKAYTLFRRAIYDNLVQAFYDILNEKQDIAGSIVSPRAVDFIKPWEGVKEFVYFGIIIIDGAVYTFPVAGEDINKYITDIKNIVRTPALYRTDSGYCIGALPLSGSHLVITKIRSETENYRVSRKIRRYWAYLADQLYHYHGIDTQHYHLYIKEIEYRFNNRAKDIFHPIAEMLVKPMVKHELILPAGK